MALIVVVAGLLVSGTSPQDASAFWFGHRDLIVGQCCGGAGLYGTKASIYTPASPNDLTFTEQRCFLARSSGEISGGTGAGIQAGWVRCHPQFSLDGTCSTAGQLEQYVETVAYGQYTCYPKGVIGYGVEVYYTVRRVGGTQWYAYIGGVQDSHGIPMGGAEYILEGGEINGFTSTSCTNNTGYADYALAVPWQRWTGTSWFTVQSSFIYLDCSWTTYGAPPGVFGFDHG